MMNIKQLSFLFSIVSLLAGCNANDSTQQPSSSTSSSSQMESENNSPQWRSLLKDKSLSQWQQVGGEAPYHVEDNIIIGTTIPSKHNSFLTTKDVFSDFIFEVDVHVDEGMNSGVQFRSNIATGYHAGKVHGYQMEIDTSDRKWSGGIFDERRRGWLYNLSRNKKCQDTFKVAQWNTYRIEAIGNHLRTFINGIPCANLIDNETSSGFIALQVHSAGENAKGKQVKWRAPKILTNNVEAFATEENANKNQFSQLSNTLTNVEKENGWSLLWSGNNERLMDDNAWQFNDDSIEVKTPVNINELTFDVPYSNFEIEIDVKIGDNLDAGIRYLLPQKATGNSKSDYLTFTLADDKLNPKAKDPKQSLGAILNKVAPVNASEPSRKEKRVKGKWGYNRVRILVAYGKAQHWMNNIKLAETNLNSQQKLSKSLLKITIAEGSMALKNLKLREIKTNPGDRAGHVMDEVVPRDIIPPAPILTIEKALASFKMPDDFALEVVAKEPLIFDPVVIQYDAAGRIWALEMTTFMQDIEGTNQMTHESQIVVLTDTNGDGEMDKRQVLIEKVLLPRALAFIEKGIIWADNEKLYFSEIENKQGEFSVIKTEVVDAIYAKGGNLEHKPNGLLFSLDNWYYNAKSHDRYRPYPLTAKLPEGAQEVYRNQYWKMAKAKTEMRGQWGIAQDDYGRHYFNYNSSTILTTPFIPNVVYRNQKHKFPNSLVHLALGDNIVYPVRVTPAINRGYQAGMYHEGYKLKYHTSASGPLVYRGNQYPEKYYGIGLTQEPAGNLVKATKISEKDGVMQGEDLFHQQSILASTDERFRPVNAYNAPDGTITIVDFYHGIIQERTFLTSYLANQIKMRDLERNKHIGRLYRLKYKHAEVPNVEYLEGLSAKALVPFLAHSNGWHRDMAQQLIVMQQDKTVIPQLLALATNTNDKNHLNTLAQIKALWTLEGLGANNFDTLKIAAQTNNAKVKTSVYRLAELLPARTPGLKAWLFSQTKNINLEASQSLSLAAGTFNAWSTLSELVNQFGITDYTFAAIGNKEQAYLNAEKENLSTQDIEKIKALINIKAVTDNKASLNKEAQASFARGETLYNGKASCFGCHGKDGLGNAMIPPLDKSEWVIGSKNRLSAVLLRGLSGPIEVNGKKYDTPMTMPGLAQNKAITDQDLADIATFIRNNWNNKASALTKKDIAQIRALTEQKTTPYNAKTIETVEE